MTEYMMGEPIPNLPLLRKVYDWARVESRRPEALSEWNQGVWRWVKPRAKVGECGTVMCLAGYTCQLEDPNWLGLSAYLYARDYDDPDHVEHHTSRALVMAPERARVLLGLTRYEAHRLFAGGNDIARIRTLCEEIAERAGEEF